MYRFINAQHLNEKWKRERKEETKIRLVMDIMRGKD